MLDRNVFFLLSMSNCLCEIRLLVNSVSGVATTRRSRSWPKKSSTASRPPWNQREGSKPSGSPVPGTQKLSSRRDSGVGRTLCV